MNRLFYKARKQKKTTKEANDISSAKSTRDLSIYTFYQEESKSGHMGWAGSWTL